MQQPILCAVQISNSQRFLCGPVSLVVGRKKHYCKTPYLIFVMNAVNAVCINFLAECKKNSRRTIKDTVFGNFVVNLRTFRV